jgi:hypothetical protein
MHADLHELAATGRYRIYLAAGLLALIVSTVPQNTTRDITRMYVVNVRDQKSIKRVHRYHAQYNAGPGVSERCLKRAI